MNEATLRADGKPHGTSDLPVADPKQGAANTKPQPQYVPVALIQAADEALAEGRIKYGVSKWRETRTEAMTYAGAILRHMFAWIEGEDIDPESLVGKRHLAGAAASLAILLDCIAAGTLVDNRPKAVGNAKLTRTAETK